jgi:hypothetical protein
MTSEVKHLFVHAFIHLWVYIGWLRISDTSQQFNLFMAMNIFKFLLFLSVCLYNYEIIH